MAVSGNKKKKRRPSLLRRILFGIYLFLVVLSVLIIVVWVGFKFLVPPPPIATPLPTAEETGIELQPPAGEPTPEPTPPPQRKGTWYQTFLLVGTDDGNGNADTIMVASYDMKNQKVGVVSIPRDTLVDEPRKVKKINGAYGAGGVTELRREVSELVGFPIDHYVKVDITAFTALVDAMGGVSFYVPCDMQHNDGAGFIIDLKEGLQYLNGEQALQLVRYRGYANADLGRIRTQQKFLTELAKQTLKVANLSKVTRFAEIFDKYVETDLSLSDLVYFGSQALGLNLQEGISFATLPGNGEVHHGGVKYYYQLYPQETLDILNTHLNPYTTPLTADMTEIYQVE